MDGIVLSPLTDGRHVRAKVLRVMAVAVVMLVATVVFHGVRAAAATEPEVILVGPSRLIHTDDQLVVEVQLDSAGQQVNAADIYLQFDPRDLKVIRVGREQSIWTVWPEQPEINPTLGQIKIIGGRPKGIIASRATMATVYFSVRHSGLTEITLRTPDSKVYRHDGLGTPVELPAASLMITAVDPLAGGFVLRSATHPTIDTWSRHGAIDVNWDITSETIYSYVLSEDRTELPDEIPDQLVVRADYTGLADGVYYFSIHSKTGGEDWSEVTRRRFLLDQTPPEPFTLDLITGQAVQNTTLLSWNATDPTSGISNYRLLVDGRDQGIVISPVVLKPDWLDKNMAIIANDAAGNRRTAELLRESGSFWRLGTIAMACAILLAIIFFLRSRSRTGRLRR